MMKKNVSISGRCRYSNRVELLCLSGKLSSDEEKQIRFHMEECLSCQKAFQALDRLYTTIDRVAETPISNSVLDLAKRVSDDEVEYGLLVCEPVEQKRSKQAAFKTKLVFCANGHVFGAHQKLSDYRLQELPKNAIAIRAMTDKVQQKLLLYLWQSGEQNYGGWELRIDGESEKTQVSPSGTAAIALRDIEELGDKVIYFKEKHSESAPGNRLDHMMACLVNLS